MENEAALSAIGSMDLAELHDLARTAHCLPAQLATTGKGEGHNLLAKCTVGRCTALAELLCFLCEDTIFTSPSDTACK